MSSTGRARLPQRRDSAAPIRCPAGRPPAGAPWRRHVLLWSLAGVLAPGAARAQEFVAIPPDAAPAYHIDFARLYFASPERELADREVLEARYATFDAVIAHFTDSAAAMLDALRLYDSLLIQFYRHDDYLWLHYTTDTRDRESADASSALEAGMARAHELVRDALRTARPDVVDGFTRQRAELEAYRYLFDTARREAAHALDPQREALIADLGPITTGWQDALYQTLLSGTEFGTLETPEGTLDVGADYARIRSSPDPGVRAEGFRRLLEGYGSRRDLYAFALIRTVKAGDAIAKLHRFPDRPSEVYFASYLSEQEVTRLVGRIVEESTAYRDYERVLADRTAAATGDEAHGWDGYAPVPGVPAPRFTIGTASERIAEALAPLGTEYGEALATLLDPANGRMDIVPGAHRRGGGFSTGFIGSPSALYTSGFEGSYRDVSRLAHESTHAVERALMSEAGVLPAYADGPHPLSESFAGFAELLLASHLYAEAGDPGLEEYYLRQFLDIKGIRELYSAASEVALEQAIYAGVSSGEVTGADDLDRLTLEVESRYSMWPEREPIRRGMWMTKPLFFEDPLYTVNYVYASLLAIA